MSIAPWRACTVSGGTFTSGGTESNFLAIKAARSRARARRPGLQEPNLVAPSSIHASAVKAAEYLGIEVRKVPYGSDFRSDVEAMARAVDDQTVLLLGSAPQFPTGVFDRITELASLARQHDLWLHVDACVGGMLSPFARNLGHPIPDFDLSIAGCVLAFGGSSQIRLCKQGRFRLAACGCCRSRAPALFRPVGLMVSIPTDTFLGTRSGGAIAAAWAVMQHLGNEGYLRRADMILKTVGALASGIDTIPGLQCIRPYDSLASCSMGHAIRHWILIW